MLGIPDPAVWIAYLLSLGGAILCVIYGIINWNKDNGGNEGGKKR